MLALPRHLGIAVLQNRNEVQFTARLTGAGASGAE